MLLRNFVAIPFEDELRKEINSIKTNKQKLNKKEFDTLINKLVVGGVIG